MAALPGRYSPSRATALLVLCCVCCAVVLTAASRPGTTMADARARRDAKLPTRRLSEDSSAPAPDGFADAPSCKSLPTANTSTADASGRLWGWRDDLSCAYKDLAGRVLFYLDYAPASWLHTPACTMAPFPDSSVADSRFKVWGWESSGSLCAFKDDQQQPIPIQKKFTRLSWLEAARCTQDPAPTAANSAPDVFGCLWGWQLDRNCAFKSADASAEPLYYEGAAQTCNISASVQRAAELNEKMANMDDSISAAEDGALPLPGTNAPVPIAGQKRRQVEYTEDDAERLFSKTGDAGAATSSTPLPATNTPTAPLPPADQQPSAPPADQQPSAPLPPADQPPAGAVGLPNDPQLKRALLQSGDPRFPKATETIVFPAGWTDGGPGGVSPPGHNARSMTMLTPLIPEAKLASANVIGAVEEEGSLATYAAVPQSKIAEAADCGLGAITPPGTRAKGGVACVAAIMAASEGTFVAADGEAGTAKPMQADARIMTPSHALSSTTTSYRRTILASAVSLATAVGTGGQASATSVSAGGGQSAATASSSGNSTATAVSNATAAANSSALAVSTANATDGGAAVAESTANAQDGANATLVVDAQAHGPNRSCVLSVSTHDGKFFWSCERPTVPALTAAATNASGNAAPAAASPANSRTIPAGSPAPAAAPAAPAPAPHSTTTADDNSAAPVSYDVLAPSWAEAALCRVPPNKSNSVQDAMGRLWGYDADSQRPCAYREADGSSATFEGYLPVRFETAPACADAPSSANSMADARGRLWGWDAERQANCAFKDPSSGEPVVYAGYAPQPAGPSSATPPQQGASAMLPSAAGPANATATLPAAAPEVKAAEAGDDAASPDSAAHEKAIVHEAAQQIKQIEAGLSPDASTKEKARAAARAALTTMVASDALLQQGTNAGVDAAVPTAEAWWFSCVRQRLAVPAVRR